MCINKVFLPLGAVGAEVRVEAKQTIITATQQGGGRGGGEGEGDVQGGGICLHHNQLTAEKKMKRFCTKPTGANRRL